MGVGIGRISKDRAVLGKKRLQGKVEARTDISKKSNKLEYRNFLNTSGIMTTLALGEGLMVDRSQSKSLIGRAALALWVD